MSENPQDNLGDRMRNQETMELIMEGAGDPNGATTAAEGSIYWDSTDHRPYANTDGATAWHTMFGRWELIAETVLGAPAASVTFANIPDDYRSLVLHSSTRTSRVGARDFLLIRLNADAGANYDYNIRTWTGAGAAATAGALAATSYAVGVNEGNTSAANAFAPSEVLILQYANASYMTQMIGSISKVGTRAALAELELSQSGGNWTNTNAVTSLTALPSVGPNFVTACVFTLYGIM